MATQTVKWSIRKGDNVQVIAGRDKGKTGKILKVDRKDGRVLVEKVNLVKRHVKPSQLNPQGGIVEKESPLNFSNVLLFCAKCDTGRRHGVKLVDGKSPRKVRFCKKCGENFDAS